LRCSGSRPTTHYLLTRCLLTFSAGRSFYYAALFRSLPSTPSPSPMRFHGDSSCFLRPPPQSLGPVFLPPILLCFSTSNRVPPRFYSPVTHGSFFLSFLWRNSSPLGSPFSGVMGFFLSLDGGFSPPLHGTSSRSLFIVFF